MFYVKDKCAQVESDLAKSRIEVSNPNSTPNPNPNCSSMVACMESMVACMESMVACMGSMVACIESMRPGGDLHGEDGDLSLTICIVGP